MGQFSMEPNLNKKGNGHQLLMAKRGDVGVPPPPPPPLGCCPQCGFRGEPACFLRSYASALSLVPVNKDAGLSTQGMSVDKPFSSVEAQGLAGNQAVPKMFDVNFGQFRRPQHNQVYVRRCSMRVTLNEVDGGSACIAEAVGSEAISLPDASIALLAPLLSTIAVDEVTLFDPARFEVDIVCQLNFDFGSSLVRDGCVPLSVGDHMGR